MLEQKGSRRPESKPLSLQGKKWVTCQKSWLQMVEESQFWLSPVASGLSVCSFCYANMVSCPNIIQVWLWPTPRLARLEYVQGDRFVFSVILLSSASQGTSTPQTGLLLIMTPENQYQEEKKIESARQNPWKCHGALIKVKWLELYRVKDLWTFIL